MRQTYVMRDGKAVPKHLAEPIHHRGPRSTVIPLPALNRDQMDPMMHPCTGELIDSKSKFREITKAHGCIEIGNEPIPAYTPPPQEDIRADVALAWQQVEQRSEFECPSINQRTNQEHQDLDNQSMTIFAPHGTSSKSQEMEAVAQAGIPIREVPPT